jgi:hypothetical protein
MAPSQTNDEGLHPPPSGLVGISRVGFVSRKTRTTRAMAGPPSLGLDRHLAHQSFLIGPMHPPPYVAGPSNWTTLAGGSARSNCSDFAIFGGGGGRSSGVDGDISFGGNLSGNYGGVRCDMNGIGSDVSYGIGGSGGSGGFIVVEGSGRGSSCPTNDTSKSNSHIRTYLEFRLYVN